MFCVGFTRLNCYFWYFSSLHSFKLRGFLLVHSEFKCYLCLLSSIVISVFQ